MTSAASSTVEGQGHASRTARPSDLSETVDLLRGSTGSVLVCGAGTKTGWAGTVRDPDLVLDTTGMDQVITHNPADMTVSVQAGTPLLRVQEHVASDGQWVALDPASASAGATVGGLLAAGDSGPSRQKYGGLRDLVIGVTVVLADGSCGRSGGHVIKNVAGYDLAKLVHGSLGSLALIAEVVLRLHPVSPSRVTVRAPADAAAATAAVLALAAGPLEPSRIAWSGGTTGEGVLLVGVEGSAEATEAAADRVASSLADGGLEAGVLSDSDAEEAWSGHQEQVTGFEGETLLAVNGLPSELAALAAVVRHGSAESDLTAELVSWAGVGMHVVRFGRGEPRQQAQAVQQVRAYADRAGCSTMLRRRPSEIDAELDVLGTPPSSVGVLRAIKTRFDPDHRLAPGRFDGWYEPSSGRPSGQRGEL